MAVQDSTQIVLQSTHNRQKEIDLVPLKVDANTNALSTVRTIVNILECKNCGRVFDKELLYLIYKDGNGNCYIHRSLLQANTTNMRRLILDVTKTVTEYSSKSKSHSTDISKTIDKIISEPTIDKMFITAESIFQSLHEF